VGQRPELWANGVRQGSVLVQDRGTVFETSFFTARASDPNPSATAVPLAQVAITPVLPDDWSVAGDADSNGNCELPCHPFSDARGHRNRASRP
jgi:hypothetical protein